MRIDITPIKQNQNGKIVLDVMVDPKDLEHEIYGFVLTGNLEVCLELTNQREFLQLEGNVRGSYQTQCARCLRDLRNTFDLSLRERFAEAGKNEVSDGDYYPYQGNEVDVSVPLTDNILLSFPRAMVCRESCKGLCGICGCDRNQVTCSCSEKERDERMSKLKEFFRGD